MSDIITAVIAILELIVTSLAILGSLYIIICYVRLLQIHGRVTWRAYLEVVFCVSISDFLMAINYCFPFFLDFVLSESLIDQYHDEGWPWYAYFDVPFGFFSGFAAWLWLAYLPDAMRWTAFGEAPGPKKKIRSLQVIWLVSLVYAGGQSAIIFLIRAHLALIIRSLLMDFVGIAIIVLAVSKYLRFYRLTTSLAVSEEDRSRFSRGLVRRAALYLAPYILLWIPTYIFTTICAFEECSTNVVRLTNLVNGLQGFAHAIVFWKEEKIHDLYQGKKYQSLDDSGTLTNAGGGAYTLLEKLTNGKLLQNESTFYPPWEPEQNLERDGSDL